MSTLTVAMGRPLYYDYGSSPTLPVPIICYCNTCGLGSFGRCSSNYGCEILENEDGVVAKRCQRLTAAILNICTPMTAYSVRSHCCNTSYCNTESALPPWPLTSTAASSRVHSPTTQPLAPEWTAISIVSVLVLVVAIVGKLCKHCCNSSQIICINGLKNHPEDDLLSVTSYKDSSSGTGREFTWLVSKTLSNNINLLGRIETGKYGMDGVFRGEMYGKDVAVKILLSKDEYLFKAEIDFYTTVLLSHENILAYIGSDIPTGHLSHTEMWIVTQYHPNGSLLKYLTENQPLETAAVLKLLMTAAAGLHHIHAEIKGIQNKPAMAHRDIKTRNVLVKMDGSCCVADFGLAIVAPVDHHIKYKIGTNRYAAPEVLDDTIDVTQFSSFQHTDVYAFSLLMWEVLTNCIKGYKLPYESHVSSNPSFDDMKEVVCTKGYREPVEVLLPDSIPANIRTPLAVLIEENWGPQHRHNMLRTEMTLTKLYKSNYTESQDKSSADHKMAPQA